MVSTKKYANWKIAGAYVLDNWGDSIVVMESPDGNVLTGDYEDYVVAGFYKASDGTLNDMRMRRLQEDDEGELMFTMYGIHYKMSEFMRV